MRGAAGAGDDQLEPAPLRRGGIIVKPLGSPVRRNDLHFVGDAEAVQRLGGVAHRLPVGPAAHDDPDQRLAHASSYENPIGPFRNMIGSAQSPPPASRGGTDFRIGRFTLWLTRGNRNSYRSCLIRCPTFPARKT